MLIVLAMLPRSFYFIRSRPGKLEYEALDSVVECGLLNEGPSLQVLEQVCSEASMTRRDTCSLGLGCDSPSKQALDRVSA